MVKNLNFYLYPIAHCQCRRVEGVDDLRLRMGGLGPKSIRR